jgi:hypothetical protein
MSPDEPPDFGWRAPREEESPANYLEHSRLANRLLIENAHEQAEELLDDEPSSIRRQIVLSLPGVLVAALALALGIGSSVQGNRGYALAYVAIAAASLLINAAIVFEQRRTWRGWMIHRAHVRDELKTLWPLVLANQDERLTLRHAALFRRLSAIRRPGEPPEFVDSYRLVEELNRDLRRA